MSAKNIRGYLLHFLLIGSAVPIPSFAENLSAVYWRAVRQDPVFDATRYALAAVLEKKPQARAGLLPGITAVGNDNSQNGSASFGEAPYLARNVRTRAWSLQLNQPLLSIGKWIAYQQAGAQIRQAEAQFAQAQQDLILRVAQAYFDVLVAEDSVIVADAQLAAVEKQLELAQRNYQVGVSTMTDTYEARSRVDLSRSQRIAASNDLEGKRAELEKITGERFVGLWVLREQASLPAPLPDSVQNWTSGAREHSPLVKAQLAAQDIAAKEIERGRSAHYPTLDLTASYGRNYSSGSISSPADIDARYRSVQVGLQLTIPIYSGGGTDSRVREAAASYNRTRADLETARRQAATAARQAFTAILSGQSQIEALLSAVESSRKSVEANKIGYRIGNRINLDVLNAEQQLATALRDLTKARYETLMQGLRLKATAGLLSDDDLRLIDGLLEARQQSSAIAQPG